MFMHFIQCYLLENDWDVYVTTGEDEKASLAGPVTLVVYSDKEHKEIILSPTHDKGFIACSIENFRVRLMSSI